jgi:hypothetical protein
MQPDETITTRQYAVDPWRYFLARVPQAVAPRIWVLTFVFWCVALYLWQQGGRAAIPLVQVLVVSPLGLIGFSVALVTRAVYYPLSKKSLELNRTMEFTQTHFLVRSENGAETKMTWRFVQRVRKRGDLLLLVLGPTQNLPILISSFENPGDFNKFWALIQSKGLASPSDRGMQ